MRTSHWRLRMLPAIIRRGQADHGSRQPEEPMDLTGPGVTKYPHLFRPIQVGKFVLRNRVKYAACSVSNFNTEDGFITDREYARMEGIARTGCAMITNQGAFPDPAGEGRA